MIILFFALFDNWHMCKKQPFPFVYALLTKNTKYPIKHFNICCNGVLMEIRIKNDSVINTVVSITESDLVRERDLRGDIRVI